MLAAGRGTRLGDITASCPKPLIPVGHSTPLGVWLSELDRHGFDEIIVNAHYLADQIVEFVESGDWESPVRVVCEENLRGTAGSTRSMLESSGISDAVVIHADNFFLGDLGPLLDAFAGRPPDVEICMYTFECEDPSDVGVVEVDSNGIVYRFVEKDPLAVSRQASAAIFAVTRSVVLSITDETDFSAEVLPRFVGRIVAVPLDGVVIDIGTPERLQHARKVAEERSAN